VMDEEIKRWTARRKSALVTAGFAFAKLRSWLARISALHA